MTALAADHPSGVLVRERNGPKVEEVGQLVPGVALVGRPGDAAAGDGENRGQPCVQLTPPLRPDSGG